MASAKTHSLKEAKRDGKLFATRNDLSEQIRTKVVKILNERLAELIDLQLAIKQAHWNIKGPQFIGVHEMFDGFRSSVDEFVDKAAERAVQLGGVAYGTVQSVAEVTSLKPYPLNIHMVLDHIEALAEHYAVVAKTVRKAIDETDKLGDADTADLFTEISRGLDMNLWFLEAHLQD